MRQIEYLAGRASLSELATRTGLDTPTIMEEIAQITGEDTQTTDSFLSAVETLSRLHNDPEFYAIAKEAIDIPVSDDTHRRNRQSG